MSTVLRRVDREPTCSSSWSTREFVARRLCFSWPIKLNSQSAQTTLEDGREVIRMIWRMLVRMLVELMNESCRLLPKFGKPPKFWRFQEIAQKISQNFYVFVKSTQKASKRYRNLSKSYQK